MTPELRFICACCRWPDDEPRREAIRRAAGDVERWDEIPALAAAHRVEGLVAHGVATAPDQVPAAVGSHFADAAGRVKARALSDLGETLRIGEALKRAGIRYCVLKGVPLGVRAFGTPLFKQSWDVDVLVDRGDAIAAAKLIAALGYGPYLPPRALTAGEFDRWSAVSKEAEFHQGDRAIELHWGLADHPMLIEGLGVGEAEARVELLGGRSVPTLNDGANLAYLAVHGAYHGWSRLKWLADLAAFLNAFDAGERAGVIAEARRWRTGLALDQALLLSNRLLGTAFGLADRLQGAEKLAGLAAISLEQRALDRDYDADPVAGRAIRQAQAGLVPGTRYRLLRALIRLKGTEDRRHLPLPRGLRWAYWPMRPFTAAWRVAGRRIAQRRNQKPPRE